jgi:hypothetical protein
MCHHPVIWHVASADRATLTNPTAEGGAATQHGWAAERGHNRNLKTAMGAVLSGTRTIDGTGIIQALLGMVSHPVEPSFGPTVCLSISRNRACPYSVDNRVKPGHDDGDARA